MYCPGFQIHSYGIFDSRVARPRQTITLPRQAQCFELELAEAETGGINYIDGEAYPLKKEQLVCCKPGMQRYSLLPTRCYYIHLNTEDPALQALLEDLPTTCQLVDSAPVLQLFQELVALPFPQDLTGALQVQSLVTSLLFLIRRQTARRLQSVPAISSRNQAMLMETETYICSHLTEPLSLEQLSRRVKFSPSHFHMLFTQWFGMTPYAFVLDCRIRAAKAALRTDRHSLIEIANDCGFSSQSHFCAQFKRATGQTPLAYRKAKLSRLLP